MSISRWFPEFQQLQKELFNDPFLGQFVKGFGPRMDISETNDTYIVRAEVPGFTKDQIDLDVHDGNLCISGKAEVKEIPNERIVSRETIDSFTRCLSLPFQVDPTKVNANLQDGILKVTLAKTHVKTSKIPIQ